MNKIKRIFVDISWGLIAQLATKVLGIGFTFVLARKLTVEEVGSFNFVIASIGIISVVLDFGIANIFQREAGKSKEQLSHYLHTVLFLKLVFVAIFIAVVAIVLLFTSGVSESTKYYFILFAISTIIDSFTSVLQIIFRIHEKFVLDSITTIVFKVTNFMLTLGVLLLIVEVHIDYLFIMYIISSTLNLFICIYVVYVYLIKAGVVSIHTLYSFKPSNVRYFLVESIYIGLSIVLWQVYYRIDTIMLGIFKDNYEIGIYSTSYALYQMVSILPAVVLQRLYPRLIIKLQEDTHEFILFSNKALKYMFLGAVPIVLGVIIFAPLIIRIIYSQKFDPSIEVLQILMVSYLTVFPGYVLGNVMTIINKTKSLLIVSLISTIFNVVANILVIPAYGYKGAAITTVVTEVLTMMMTLFLYTKALKELKYDSKKNSSNPSLA